MADEFPLKVGDIVTDGQGNYARVERVLSTDRLDHTVEALRRERDDIASLERRLKAARARRKVLVAKLRRAGWTLRQIEPHAGISNAAISQQEDR